MAHTTRISPVQHGHRRIPSFVAGPLWVSSSLIRFMICRAVGGTTGVSEGSPIDGGKALLLGVLEWIGWCLR